MHSLDPSIVSFYGADGVGKTKIARSYTQSLLSQSKKAVVIGGSSYQEWLTPQVAKETLGYENRLNCDPTNPSEREILYGQIAVACYGYAAHLNEIGTQVAIDSDPLLKKLIWEKLHLPPDEYARRVSRFGEYVLDRLPLDAFPDYVVGINMNDEISAGDLYQRIARRTDNTEHDPKSIDEASCLLRTVHDIWVDLEASVNGNSTVDLFNERFGSAEYLLVKSPQCAKEEIQYYADQAAAQVREEIGSGKQSLVSSSAS